MKVKIDWSEPSTRVVDVKFPRHLLYADEFGYKEMAIRIEESGRKTIVSKTAYGYTVEAGPNDLRNLGSWLVKRSGGLNWKLIRAAEFNKRFGEALAAIQGQPIDTPTKTSDIP